MLYLDAYFANLNLVVRVAGFLSCKKNDEWSNNKAEFEQNKFYYITNGRCVININGKEFHGKKGDCFFIPANTPHHYYNIKEEPFEKYWFHFDLYPDSSIFKLLGLDYCLNITDGGFLKNFDELILKYGSKQLTDKLDVKSLAFKILSSYIAASDKEIKISLPDSEEKFSYILSYINQNLEKPLSNEKLSELCYQHPTHFVRVFKQKTGTTPQKYITDQRVQMAKRLIEQTDMKFSDIATQSGFYDASHLHKVFKKYFSITPLEHRKRRNRH